MTTDRTQTPIRAYIVTHKRPDVLQRAVDSFWAGVHDPSQVSLTILNNHSDFRTPTSAGPVRVVQNEVRSDGSWGHLARDWNSCLVDAFGDWRGGGVDWCLLAQNDVEWLPDWQRRLAALGNRFDFFSQPRGDQSMGFRIEALRRVGFFDERFSTIGHQAQDYFTRAAIVLGDRASINDDHFPDQPPWNPVPPVINESTWHVRDESDPLHYTDHFGQELENYSTHKWQTPRPLDIYDRPLMVRRWRSGEVQLPDEVELYPFFWDGAPTRPPLAAVYEAPLTPRAAARTAPVPLGAGALTGAELRVDLPPVDGLGEVAGALEELLDLFASQTRPQDPVTLVLQAAQTGSPDAQVEREALEALQQRLPEALARLDTAAPVDLRAWSSSSPPALDLTRGTPSPDALTSALQLVHRHRELSARFVALTPVQNRASWARDFVPTAGFAHLVVDNASGDGTRELLQERGARVVAHDAAVSRTASWSRAVTAARELADGRWTKWLFAGDELEDDAAQALSAAVDAAPHVGLVVCEYVIDHGTGRRDRWSTLGETRLVSPREALALSAEHGNWFGSPIGHLFSPEGLELLEVGTSPYVADWHACLSVARHLPTLYFKHVVGTFSGPSRQHWQSAGDGVHARVQELEVRLRSATDLGDEGTALLARVEQAAGAFFADLRRSPVRTAPASAATGVEEAGPRPSTPVVAVQQPRLTVHDRDFHGYAPIFARQAQLAYLPQLAGAPALAAQLGVVDGALHHEGGALEVVTTQQELQRRADVLVCFEGRPYLPELSPPPGFTGLKAFHVMDFVFYASQAAEALRRGGTDLLLGYARHDVHSPFFADVYRGFEGRVRAVPFGFGSRFSARTPFSERRRLAIGLGAVNPVDDPLCPPGELDDYTSYHRGTRWTHAWRRRLAEEAPGLGDVLDSRFPVWPQTKDPDSDAPGLLDAHQLFVNDVGLMAFPPVRTYEGTASGAVLVAPAHPVYEELGFVHGVNALFHSDQDVDDFRRTVREAVADQPSLLGLATAGTSLVRRRFNHDAVSEDLMDLLRSSLAPVHHSQAPVRG